MEKRIKVLVLAVGSPLGQSIVKALKSSKLNPELHIADINQRAAGLHLFKEKQIILPLVKSSSYGKELFQYVKNNEINVIFPTIAQEHKFFAENYKEFESLGVFIASCSQKTFSICNDKFESMEELRKGGLLVPDTVVCTNKLEIESFVSRNEFPIILKPRFGASSNHVFVTKSYKQLKALVGAFEKGYFVAQEFLSDPKDYTVGVYISKDNTFRDALVLDRNLKFGLSYSGTICDNNLIRQYALDAAKLVDAYYSVNVQLKLKNGIPYAYEINPRLSSTTGIRAYFGFNEPDMILREFAGLPLEHPVKSTRGEFSRYWEEIYIKN